MSMSRASRGALVACLFIAFVSGCSAGSSGAEPDEGSAAAKSREPGTLLYEPFIGEWRAPLGEDGAEPERRPKGSGYRHIVVTAEKRGKGHACGMYDVLDPNDDPSHTVIGLVHVAKGVCVLPTEESAIRFYEDASAATPVREYKYDFPSRVVFSAVTLRRRDGEQLRPEWTFEHPWTTTDFTKYHVSDR